LTERKKGQGKPGKCPSKRSVAILINGSGTGRGRHRHINSNLKKKGAKRKDVSFKGEFQKGGLTFVIGKRTET